MANSDNEEVIILRYFLHIIFHAIYDVFSSVHNSLKKARVKEPFTPSKTVKNVAHQLVFDNAVYV